MVLMLSDLMQATREYAMKETEIIVEMDFQVFILRLYRKKVDREQEGGLCFPFAGSFFSGL
ncbi:MAG: hypothetical protein KAT29_13820, partial [Anaerolineales bacterium]|nr:hypothetical protein [Anaerolineales bacterium]